jgi:hypothetical protein
MCSFPALPSRPAVRRSPGALPEPCPKDPDPEPPVLGTLHPPDSGAEAGPDGAAGDVFAELRHAPTRGLRAATSSQAELVSGGRVVRPCKRHSETLIPYRSTEHDPWIRSRWSRVRYLLGLDLAHGEWRRCLSLPLTKPGEPFYPAVQMGPRCPIYPIGRIEPRGDLMLRFVRRLPGRCILSLPVRSMARSVALVRNGRLVASEARMFPEEWSRPWPPS